MCNLIPEFGDQFYYLDQMDFSTHTSTRLLLSDNDYGFLDVVDLKEYGSPLRRRRWEHAVMCRSETYECDLPHVLEVAIEVNDRECKWLYNNCKVESNNHSMANVSYNTGNDNAYQSDVCHRHNFFGRECPTPFSKKYAKGILKSYYADLIDI